MGAVKKIIIIDSAKARRTEIVNSIAEVLKNCELPFQVIGYENVWGNGDRPIQMSYVMPGDIVFIHANEKKNPSWDSFLEDKCSQSIVICFSGSGVEGLSRPNIKHFSYNNPLSEDIDHHIEQQWHFKEFLTAVQQNDEDPFFYLLGYDQNIEAALNDFYESFYSGKDLKKQKENINNTIAKISN